MDTLKLGKLGDSLKTAKSAKSGNSSAISLKRVASAAVATLALTGTEVANAEIVTLPVGVDSIVLGGNFDGTPGIGGLGKYTLFDANGNEYRGNALLGVPVENSPYILTLEAMRETGERFNMIMEFDTLQFTGEYRFEAINLGNTRNSISQEPSYAIGNWYDSGYGDVFTNYANATIPSPIPEPSSLALMATGLGLAGLASRRRRSAIGAAPATGTTQKSETAEEASV